MGGSLDIHELKAAFGAMLGVAAAVAALSLPQPAAANTHSCNHAKASPKAISTRQAKHAVACLLNKQRDANGLPSLNLNDDLTRAARDHSRHMERSGCFDHDCPGEPTVVSRLQNVNYIVPGLVRWLYGENIGWGADRLGTPAAMVKAWMQSAGHRANILSSSFRDLGVGVTWGTPGNPHGDGGIYTTDFGYRR